MFKNNHLLRMFSMLALLAFGCGERLMAEEPAPEKEKIHIVGLPPDTEVNLWTKTSNKDGMTAVVLETNSKDMPYIQLLALVSKEGTIVKGPQFRDPDADVIDELIWLNDVSFLTFASGRARSFYAVYVISRGEEGGYALSCLNRGVIYGRTEFVVQEDILTIIRNDAPLLEIAIPSPEKNR